jgi:hypothetical protein
MANSWTSGGVAALALAACLVAGPAMAKTNCHTLCKTEIKACSASLATCKSLKGTDKASCLKTARAQVRTCKSGILTTCTSTGSCS